MSVRHLPRESQLEVLHAIKEQVDQENQSRCLDTLRRGPPDDVFKFCLFLRENDTPLLGDDNVLNGAARVSRVIAVIKSIDNTIAYELKQQFLTYMQDLRLAHCFDAHPKVDLDRLTWDGLRNNVLTASLYRTQGASFNVDVFLLRYPLLCVEQATLNRLDQQLRGLCPVPQKETRAIADWVRSTERNLGSLASHAQMYHQAQVNISNSVVTMKQLSVVANAVSNVATDCHAACMEEALLRKQNKRVINDIFIREISGLLEADDLAEAFRDPVRRQEFLQGCPLPADGGDEVAIRVGVKDVMPRRCYEQLLRKQQVLQDIGKLAHKEEEIKTRLPMPDVDEEKLVDEVEIGEQRIQREINAIAHQAAQQAQQTNMDPYDTLVDALQAKRRELQSRRMASVDTDTPFFRWMNQCETLMQEIEREVTEKIGPCNEKHKQLLVEADNRVKEWRFAVKRVVESCAETFPYRFTQFVPANQVLSTLQTEMKKQGQKVNLKELQKAAIPSVSPRRPHHVLMRRLLRTLATPYQLATSS